MPAHRRLLRIFCACAALAVPARAAAPPAPAPARSLVYAATEADAIDDFHSNPAAERRMVERLVTTLKGQSDLGKAWQCLVRPDDRIGIKVATAGGPVFSTHPGIVAAIIAGLEQAGIPRSAIVVWDRDESTLRAAGYTEARGFPVRAIDPPRGLDPAAKFVAPMLGTLIWGDLSFQGKAAPRLRSTSYDQDVSSESHLARILSHDVTRIISVPVFCEERGCGVAGAFYNVTVPNVDNSRRFTQEGGASSICDLFSDPHIGPKVTLTLVDGLLAQYAAGPEFNPNYSLHHRTLYASRDPVALDGTLLRKLEGWRKEARLPAIGERASWLGEAQSLGLGNFDPERVEVVPVGTSL